MMNMINIARVVDGVVANIEIADQDWVSENDNVNGVRLVSYVIENSAHIGFRWDEQNGFEQPDVSVDPEINAVFDGG